jgi:cytochrome c oxidase subunit 1
MASDAITVPVGQTEAKPWVDELHQWVTTVDHKRLGILYIVSSLLFLAVGGVEALIIRIQLMHSHNNFVSPAECLQFLAFGARRISSLLQLGRRKWALRGG